MEHALELTKGHRTHPNPTVGAVVMTSDGSVVGEGFHRGPGHDHAEVVALNAAGDRAKGADLYVTLEPCSFHGRTPPCVDTVIEAGVARVFVGIEDPDERVAGSGIEHLRAKGIEVRVWDQSEKAESADPAYFHQRRTGLARITLKYAMTLDGSVAASDGTSKWITSDAARQDAHRLRAAADAVVVGAGTVRADDPRLDVRLDDFNGPQPRPVIIAGSSEIPVAARIWNRKPLVIAASDMEIPSGELEVVGGEEYPDPEESARALAERGYLDCLLEGGPSISGAWWSAGLIQAGVVYLGGRMGGGIGRPPLATAFQTFADSKPVRITNVRTIGSDVRIDFE